LDENLVTSNSSEIFICSMDVFVKKIHVFQLKGLCFAAEGFNGGGVEILLDSTQPSCCWKEGSFDQQDINTHGEVSDLIRFTKNISFAKSEALCDNTCFEKDNMALCEDFRFDSD
jgi:hypothetical protein